MSWLGPLIAPTSLPQWETPAQKRIRKRDERRGRKRTEYMKLYQRKRRKGLGANRRNGK